MAQSFATLQAMHDERVILGMSTGEAMKQTPLGHNWPEYSFRRNLLEGTLDIIHLLWESDGFVDYDSRHSELDGARLYTKPDELPEIHIAANGPSTASLTSEYGDRCITIKTGEETPIASIPQYDGTLKKRVCNQYTE